MYSQKLRFHYYIIIFICIINSFTIFPNRACRKNTYQQILHIGKLHNTIILLNQIIYAIVIIYIKFIFSLEYYLFLDFFIFFYTRIIIIAVSHFSWESRLVRSRNHWKAMPAIGDGDCPEALSSRRPPCSERQNFCMFFKTWCEIFFF